MNTVHSPTEPSLSGDGVAVRHSQVRHPVQRRAPDKQLRRLPGKAACTDSLAEDRLHPEDSRLGQRAPMVAALPLPLSPPFAPDGSQVLITDVSFSFRVAVVPDARPISRRDRSSRFSRADRVITVAAVIGSIGRDLLDLLCHFCEQVLKQLRVFEVIGRDRYGDKLMGRFVHAEVEFAPRAAAGVAMLAHLPLALAIDFDAGGINNHVDWFRLPQARQRNGERAAAARERRVTGHAQLNAKQPEDRARQPFGGSQRQAVNLFQSRHAENSRISVSGRLATPARAGLVVPCLKNILAHPQRQTSTVDESFVIFSPVTETVRAFSFLAGHASRITALPSP